MDIKDLNKPQLILLTLLVSFVTSIATGITTVSLLEQAPAQVSRTINHVVERTIEKVVPGDTKKTETIVIRQDDLVVDAIDKNTPALVKISTVKTEEKESTDLGIGFIISSDGFIATDATLIAKDGVYQIEVNGSTYQITFVRSGDGVALFQIKTDDASPKKKFTAVSFGKATSVKIGQTVIALTGNPVAMLQGTVTELVTSTVPSDLKDPVKTITEISINEGVGKRYAGAPVFDIDGSVVGMVTKGTDGYQIIPENILQDLVNQKEAKETK